ncbi:MAG: lipoate--protein ligase family protein [Pseudomonadota bacterium]
MTPKRFATADLGIAFEEDSLRAGGRSVLMWTAHEPAIVVPRTREREAGFEALGARAAEGGWPLLVRSSGGGAVPQGPGTLNLALISPLRRGSTIVDGYRALCGAIADALLVFGVQAQPGGVDWSFCDGVWNVTVAGKKLAGTAQRWRSAGGGTMVALLHAAIVVQMPPDNVWPLLDAVERSGSAKLGVRKEVHTSLAELLDVGACLPELCLELERCAHAQLAQLTGPA